MTSFTTRPPTAMPLEACPCAAPGRPREFERRAALKAGLELFWRQGYEQTSLEELTAAMGISRSSFYACFGSKHEILLEAVAHYCDESYARLSAILDGAGDPAQAARALVLAIADPQGGRQGCFLANCVTELAPHDAEIEALARRQLARTERLLAETLASTGGRDKASERAGALLALALGATMLRKAGTSPVRLSALLAQADRLITA